MQEWVESSFFNLHHPFHVHNEYAYISWLERYSKPHPPQILAMWDDITSGKVDITLRRTDDIECLLKSTDYRTKRFLVKYGLNYADRFMLYPLRRFRGYVRRLKSILLERI
jgi:hypothetical protein